MRPQAWLTVFLTLVLTTAVVGAQTDGGASCATSDDCALPLPYCNGLTHACVQCVSTANCGSGVCNAATGLCVECLNDAVCPYFAPYCDTQGMCVECRVDRNCGTQGAKCVSGSCGTCGDGICSQSEMYQGCFDCYCSLYPYYCYDGGVTPIEGGVGAYCGDGVVSSGEECDGNSFGSPATCASLTLGQLPVGSVFCSSSCLFSTILCRSAVGSGGYPSIGAGGAPRGAAGFVGIAGSGGGSGSGGLRGVPTACTPGQQVHCACAGQADGIQVCASDGLKFNACQCLSPGGSAGSGDAGTAAKEVTTGGCGCRLGSSPSGQSSAAWLSLALLVARRRGRGRKRRPGRRGAPAARAP